MKTPIQIELEKTFDFVGYVPMESYLSALEKHAFYDKYILEEDYKKYQTIALVGLAYPDKPLAFKGEGYGLLSRYSYGIDYHQVMEKRFASLHQKATLLSEDIQTFSDVSPLNERLVASLTHQGFIGKNQAFIHKDFGPYVYLATVLLNRDIADDIFSIDSCLDCRKCIDACPTGALDHGFNQNLCLSHITQSKKVLSDFEISHIKKMVYGCDVCYQVCPKRLNVKRVHHPEFEPSGIENVDLHALLNMSNKAYKDLYQDNASSWRGPTVIRRNALAILYHQGNPKSIPIIQASMARLKVPWYQETAQKILDKFKEKSV